MKKMLLLSAFVALATFSLKAQSLKLDYFTKLPLAIKNCGSCYTADTVGLQKKKYLLLTDFQNLGIISIGGRQIKLQLTDTKTEGKINTCTYSGEGYTVILSYQTISQSKKMDMEKGTLQVTKGTLQTSIKVHGQSHCDESKQEGNG